MKRIIGFLALGIFGLLQAQVLPKMVLVLGGTADLGGGFHYRVEGECMVLLGKDSTYDAHSQGHTLIGEVPEPNVVTRQVTVHRFRMSETEVTNLQYREFLLQSILGADSTMAFKRQLKAAEKKGTTNALALWNPIFEKAAAQGWLPDTNCWQRDFPFAANGPLVHNYFWHPAFSEYPVVGVSWDQTQAYCAWLTEYVNAPLKGSDKILEPDYRLPTEAEWEFAARAPIGLDDGVIQLSPFPWAAPSIRDARGKWLANVRTGQHEYIGDNYEYTAPVRSFGKQSNGLYEMAGNVGEWCEDDFVFRQQEDMSLGVVHRRIQLFDAIEDMQGTVSSQHVVKGGSWADFYYAANGGSRMGWPQSLGSSRIGFRVAQIVLGSPF